MPATSDAAALRPAHPSPRPLRELLDAVPGLRVAGDAPLSGVTVTGCSLDSRTLRSGDLYAALPGDHTHGASFATQALGAGAVAVLTDEQGAAGFPGVPVLVADAPRAVLGEVAAWVHDYPASSLMLLGVTGTNGKTTTAFLIEAGLRAAGLPSALLGTVLSRIGDLEVTSIRTTPEATDLQAMFALMRERGVEAVSMEVSSHALALGRVDGLRFATSVFTNLSQDHLDFHPSMEDYYQAKASLFEQGRSGRGVINADDAAGRRLLAAAACDMSSFSTADADADWRATDIVLRPDGSTFRLVGPEVSVDASVQLPGDFNISNAVAAIACLIASGVPVEDSVRGVGSLTGVPGRMERVDLGQPFTALVDYAHTPAAVETLLRSVRQVTSGRIFIVLGCGGDRDAAKRPLMGRAAVEGADVAVLTSDNPRGEDPLEILAQMGQPGAIIEPDRRAAITWAVGQAAAGDAVVIAGKGHERGQETGGVVLPFDDHEVLREALREVVA